LLHHLLYVASPSQIELTRKALERLKATPFANPREMSETYRVDHPILENNMVLSVTLLSDLDAITPHLRRNAVDLLIYDERAGGIESMQALAKISTDVLALAELWGPDFVFPMSRVVTILNENDHNPHRIFELGRVNVRDICVAPKSTAHLLRWLARVLNRGVVRNARIGMGLSGGGLEGFLYQIGVLHALSRCLTGRSIRTVDVYSGISSGSICATLMAGEVPTEELLKAMVGKSEILAPLDGSLLYDLDGVDIAKRVIKQSIAWAGIDPNKWVKKLVESIPTGLFKGDALKEYFKNAIQAYGHDDSFETIKSELYIGATDQDSYEHISFGKAPWNKVPISDALRASCALPPFFKPMQIGGRWFIDGQVTRTVNLELLVDRGCRLVIIVDPFKPLATQIPGTVDKRGGVYSMIQTVKALVHSRFQATLTHMTERYPDVDFIVFQPDEECAQMMAGSPMRYRMRTQIVNLAYSHTLRQLRERHAIYAAKLNRFGFNLMSPEELMELEKKDANIFESLD
jgi:predicted acylesterase/phospholipase RssA